MAFVRTQNDLIVGHLLKGKTLNTAQARNIFGVERLSARIQELRQEGFPVFTTRVNGQTAYEFRAPNQKLVRAAYRVYGASLFR
jgi:hypothetical protein